MLGLAMYNQMMSAYIEKLQNADTSSEEKYNAVVDECNQELLEFISRMREVEPLLVPITFVNEDYPNNIQVDKFIKRVTDRANNRRKLDYVFAGCCVTREIQKRIWRFPTFINIKETPNFGIYPKENNCHPRIICETLNQIILSCLVSLPAGFVKVHLIDPQRSNMASYLTQIIPSTLWKVYNEDEEIYALWDSLTDYMKTVTSNLSSEDRYITHLVVILEYEHNSYERSTRFLRECGFQSGIHFIYVCTKNLYLERCDVIIDERYFFKNDKDEANLLIKPYKLINSPKLVLACSNYLNSIPTEALNQLQQFDNNYEEFHKSQKEKAIIRKAEETARRKAEEEAKKNAEEIVRKEIDEIKRKALEEARKNAEEIVRKEIDEIKRRALEEARKKIGLSKGEKTIHIPNEDENQMNHSISYAFDSNSEDIGRQEMEETMRLKGYERISEIRACFVEKYIHSRGEAPKYGWEHFVLYGKPMGSITIFRICGTKYEYEIEKTGERTLLQYLDVGVLPQDDEIEYIKVNAQFTNHNNEQFYFYMPY